MIAYAESSKCLMF